MHLYKLDFLEHLTFKLHFDSPSLFNPKKFEQSITCVTWYNQCGNLKCFSNLENRYCLG